MRGWCLVVSKRTGVVIAGGLAVVVVAVALSGGSSSKKATATTPAPTSASSAPPDWSHLVARVSCTAEGRITVSGYDPGTWALVTTASFPSPLGVAMRLDDGTSLDVAGGIDKSLCVSDSAGKPEATVTTIAGELFNPDFTRMAVSIFKQGKYNHAGYITRAGDLVDVTAKDPNLDAAAAGEGDPVFSPDGKALVFAGYAANGIRPLGARNVDTGARTMLGSLVGDTGVPLLLPGGRAVEFSHEENVAVSPAGTAVAIGAAVGDTSLSIWHLPASGQADGHGRVGVLHAVSGGGTAEPWQLAACVPQAWVDDSTVLCEASGAAQDLGAPSAAVYTVKVDAAAAAADAPRAEESALSVGTPLIPPAANRFFGEELVIGTSLWCWEVDGTAAHVQTVPVAGGTPHTVPAADPAFSAPGFFLMRGAAR